MSERLAVVAVLGSGTHGWAERAEPLGRWLADQPCHLLTGGGGGTMAAVARAFVSAPGRRGCSLGILPGASDEAGCRSPAGYPNDAVEIAIRTHLPWSGERGTDPLSRNHLNVLTADLAVVLPGGAGTRSELELAMRYRCPVIVWASESEMPDLPRGTVRVVSLDEVCRWVSRRLSTGPRARPCAPDDRP